MADQASVNQVGGDGQPEGVVGNLAEFANDVATLVELQAKLAALDFKEATTRAILPLVLVLVGVVLLLASLPVALLGVGEVLASWLSIRTGWAYLLTAALAMIVAALLAGIFARRLLGSFESFGHSREELVRNISWLRTVLVHSGRSIPRGRRF